MYNNIKHHDRIPIEPMILNLPYSASYINNPRSVDLHFFETRSILLTTLIAKLSSYHIIAQ